jgi:hypothetical protein
VYLSYDIDRESPVVVLTCGNTSFERSLPRTVLTDPLPAVQWERLYIDLEVSRRMNSRQGGGCDVLNVLVARDGVEPPTP